MQLEFHQLNRRWEHLRVREPHRQRHLLASLAENGQQTPIVVVVSKDDSECYLVIDGYKRIAALQQLALAVRLANSQMLPSQVELVKLQLHGRATESEYARNRNWAFAGKGEVSREPPWDQ